MFEEFTNYGRSRGYLSLCLENAVYKRYMLALGKLANGWPSNRQVFFCRTHSTGHSYRSLELCTQTKYVFTEDIL